MNCGQPAAAVHAYQRGCGPSLLSLQAGPELVQATEALACYTMSAAGTSLPLCCIHHLQVCLLWQITLYQATHVLVLFRASVSIIICQGIVICNRCQSCLSSAVPGRCVFCSGSPVAAHSRHHLSSDSAACAVQESLVKAMVVAGQLVKAEECRAQFGLDPSLVAVSTVELAAHEELERQQYLRLPLAPEAVHFVDSAAGVER